MMSSDELKLMEKEVKKLKRIATERAGEVHDLVEDRLYNDYEKLPELAAATVEACRAFVEAQQQLNEQV